MLKLPSRAVPLPPALPLFATGLGASGFFLWGCCLGAGTFSVHQDFASGDRTALRPRHAPRNDPSGTGIYFCDPCLCCRLRLSSGHFESSSRDVRARHAHRLGHSSRKFQPYTHCVISVPAAVLPTPVLENRPGWCSTATEEPVLRLAWSKVFFHRHMFRYQRDAKSKSTLRTGSAVCMGIANRRRGRSAINFIATLTRKQKDRLT